MTNLVNLVIAEHDSVSIKAATLNTIAAAQKIGGDIHVLVAGHNAQAAADAAAKIAGVSKVLLADAAQLEAGLAENVQATVMNIAKDYTHILTPALRLGGSVTFSVFRRNATSTPRSAGFNVSSGFFFAFMMFGSVT